MRLRVYAFPVSRTLFCFFVFVNSYKMDLDPYIVQRQLEEYIVHSLKQEAMQKHLDGLNFNRKNLPGKQLLKNLVETLGKEYGNRLRLVKRIGDAIKNNHLDTSEDIVPCCGFFPPDKKYDQRFLTEVSLNYTCSFVSPNSAKNPKIKLKKGFTKACQENFKELPTLKWQYFGSEEGITASYPSVGDGDGCDSYEPRIRPWYVQASAPQPKQVVIVVDRSGSMTKTKDGVELMTLAREAVLTIISAMNPYDKVALLAMSSEQETLGDFTSGSECFKINLAQATPQNKVKLKDFVINMVASGGTYYSRSLIRAFNFFLNETDSGNSADSIIHFLSDGTPNDSPEEIFSTLKQKHKELNNSVKLMTYAVGSEGHDILKKMADSNQARLKKGEFIVISDPRQLRNELASFYKFYAAGRNNSDEPIWTVPYLDTWGLAQMMTASLPIYVDGDLVGVAGLDFVLEDLFAKSTYFRPNEFSYSFVIDETGLVINHPLFPYVDDTDSVFVSAAAFETEPEFQEILASMRRGENGEKTFNTTLILNKGDSRKYGVETRKVEASYFWDRIPNTKLSICVVLVGNTYEVLDSQGSLPSGSFLYHRLDLSPANVSCNHISVYSAKNRSTLFLAPQVFSDTAYYLDNTFTAEDVQTMKDYMEGNGPNVHNLKEGVKNDVVATYPLDLWWSTHDANTELQEDVYLRYVGTKSGIYRNFPGHQTSKTYDPNKRPWFQAAVSNRKKIFTVAAPYSDATTGRAVITLSSVLFKNRNLSEYGQDERETADIFGVMGIDFILDHFHVLFLEWYPICKEIKTYKCYFIDNSGFVVTVSSKDAVDVYKYFEDHDWKIHISEVEPEITKDLIEHNVLLRKSCSNIEAGLFQRTYSIPEDQGIYWHSFETSFFDLFDFKLIPVPDTNTYLLIHLYTDSPCSKVFFSCPCQSQKCETLGTEKNNCECPCATSNPYFDSCLNKYLVTEDSPPPCTPLNPKLPTQGGSDEIDVKLLPMCYQHSFLEIEDISSSMNVYIIPSVVGGVVCLVAFAIILIYVEKTLKRRDLEKNKNRKQSVFYHTRDVYKKYSRTLSQNFSYFSRRASEWKDQFKTPSTVETAATLSSLGLDSITQLESIKSTKFSNESSSIQEQQSLQDGSILSSRENISRARLESLSANSNLNNDTLDIERKILQRIRRNTNEPTQSGNMEKVNDREVTRTNLEHPSIQSVNSIESRKTLTSIHKKQSSMLSHAESISEVTADVTDRDPGAHYDIVKIDEETLPSSNDSEIPSSSQETGLKIDRLEDHYHRKSVFLKSAMQSSTLSLQQEQTDLASSDTHSVRTHLEVSQSSLERRLSSKDDSDLPSPCSTEILKSDFESDSALNKKLSSEIQEEEAMSSLSQTSKSSD